MYVDVLPSPSIEYEKCANAIKEKQNKRKFGWRKNRIQKQTIKSTWEAIRKKCNVERAQVESSYQNKIHVVRECCSLRVSVVARALNLNNNYLSVTKFQTNICIIKLLKSSKASLGGQIRLPENKKSQNYIITNKCVCVVLCKKVASQQLVILLSFCIRTAGLFALRLWETERKTARAGENLLRRPISVANHCGEFSFVYGKSIWRYSTNNR